LYSVLCDDPQLYNPKKIKKPRIFVLIRLKEINKFFLSASETLQSVGETRPRVLASPADDGEAQGQMPRANKKRAIRKTASKELRWG
jgi:hypothetical protein